MLFHQERSRAALESGKGISTCEQLRRKWNLLKMGRNVRTEPGILDKLAESRYFSGLKKQMNRVG